MHIIYTPAATIDSRRAFYYLCCYVGEPALIHSYSYTRCFQVSVVCSSQPVICLRMATHIVGIVPCINPVVSQGQLRVSIAYIN